MFRSWIFQNIKSTQERKMRRCNGQGCEKKRECQRHHESKHKTKQYGEWTNPYRCYTEDFKDFIKLGEKDNG